MSNGPLLEAGAIATIGLDRTNSRGQQLPSAPGTANSWSAWQQISSATPFLSEGFLLHAANGHALGRNALVEIGIGAAASEVAIAGPFSLDPVANIAREGASLWVPVRMRKGVRVAARWRSTAVGPGGGLYPPRIAMTLMGSGPLLPVGAAAATLTVGATIDASNTEGTTVNGGGSANTPGAYVELTASLASRVRGFYIAFTAPSGKVGRTSYIVDVACGGAGAEVVIASAHVTGDVSSDLAPRMAGPFLKSIPAGTRIAARVQCASTTANVREVGCYVLGIT